MELNLYAALSSLSVYRNLLSLRPIHALKEMMGDMEQQQANIDKYTEVLNALLEEGFDSMVDYLNFHLKYDDNFFADSVARGEVNDLAKEAAQHDVEVLNIIANLPCVSFKEGLIDLLPANWEDTLRTLPEWHTGGTIPFDDLFHFYEVNGSGLFARYQAFVWQDGKLHPVPAPDFRREETLWGYERQRNQVIENTRSLMRGKSVNNVLLYGKSGTGKSATVKSMLGMEEFEGLRLIEVPKDELVEIPSLVRMLGRRPQKFIIFIDDLSFDKEDKTFSCLKTILEGGLEPRPDNVAVYCTSNRRHLVRQNFSDRRGDEVDANETIQDKTSLAARFGLKILYNELTKPQFLQMAEALTRAAGLELSSELIQEEAVKWDIRHPSRSPRSANQFVASLMAKY